MRDTFNYTEQEKRARHLLINEGLETVEHVALMTSGEVLEKIKKYFEVIFAEDEKILLIKKGEDMATFKSIAKFLMR